MLQSLLTRSTCADACWYAREDVCRCSCNGRNHGCLRDEKGERPPRTRRVKQHFYQLVSVMVHLPNSCMAEMMNPIHDQERRIYRRAREQGYKTTWGFNGQPANAAVLVKLASEDEVKRWPELASWRGQYSRPYTLWVRQDLIHLVKEDKNELRTSNGVDNPA